jgi:hypothetical protein
VPEMMRRFWSASGLALGEHILKVDLIFS